MSITEKKRKSSENNIFWSAGFDSTFLLCKKLIIDKEEVTPYYLDFDIDMYNIDGDDLPTGRHTRSLEKKVCGILESSIKDKFPHTENLLSPLQLVTEVELSDDITRKWKYLVDTHKIAPRNLNQVYYLIQYANYKKDMFQYGMEGDDNFGGGMDTVIDDDYSNFSSETQVLRKHLREDNTISSDEVNQLDIFNYITFPVARTYRKEMLDIAIEYNFKDILEKTWSCRWPQFNGQRCTKHDCYNMCIESQEFIKDYDFKRAYSIK